jgi:hypothetical protein
VDHPGVALERRRDAGFAQLRSVRLALVAQRIELGR